MNLEVFMKLRLRTGRLGCQLVQAHHQPADDLFNEIGNPKRRAYLIALAECGNKAQAARVTAPMTGTRRGRGSTTPIRTTVCSA